MVAPEKTSTICYCRGKQIISMLFLIIVNIIKVAHGDNRCQRIFRCERCIATPGCGWCDGYKYKLCQFVTQKHEWCGGGEDTFISSYPKGQQCPSQLFQGSTLGPKIESKGRLGLKGRQEDYAQLKKNYGNKFTKFKDTVYRDYPWRQIILWVDSTPNYISKTLTQMLESVRSKIETQVRIYIYPQSASDNHIRKGAGSSRKAVAMANTLINMLMDEANNTNEAQRQSCLNQPNCLTIRPEYKKFWDIQSAGWKAGGLPSKTAPRASAGACAAFLAKPKFDVCTNCSIFFSPYDPVTQRSTDVCWKRNFEFKVFSEDWKNQLIDDMRNENAYRKVDQSKLDYPQTVFNFEVVDGYYIEFVITQTFYSYDVRNDTKWKNKDNNNTIGPFHYPINFSPKVIRQELMTSHPILPVNMSRPRTCGEIKRSNLNAISGRYIIYPASESDAEAEIESSPYGKEETGVSVWCNMDFTKGYRIEEADDSREVRQSRKWSTNYQFGMS